MAIAFGEDEAGEARRPLESCDRLFAANLLEAELRAAFAREGVVQGEDDLLAHITWVFPAEALTAEYMEALRHGRLRGADLRHLACAMYLARLIGPGGSLDFVSLDGRQQRAAAAVGLGMPRGA